MPTKTKREDNRIKAEQIDEVVVWTTKDGTVHTTAYILDPECEILVGAYCSCDKSRGV